MIKVQRCEGATLPETFKLHVQTVPADKEAETGLLVTLFLWSEPKWSRENLRLKDAALFESGFYAFFCISCFLSSPGKLQLAVAPHAEAV